MLVRAIKRGFFGGLYRTPGDPKTEEFEIEGESQFSKSWMEEVGKENAPTDPIDNSNIKETKDFVTEPLEIPDLMNKPRRKRRTKAEIEEANANGAG